MLVGFSGCLSYSHYMYSKRATSARVLPEGVGAKPGRIYFASFPENKLDVSILGWHPNVGHASLVTSDNAGVVKQYDYGWFKGEDAGRPDDASEYVDNRPGYGVVKAKTFPSELSIRATNDMEIAHLVLDGMANNYGGKIELWAQDVSDIGIAERYMEQLAHDETRRMMLWRCWQIGGNRCGNVTRQAFDAARGEGHFLDLLWGGFPGADAPSIGTDKTAYSKE